MKKVCVSSGLFFLLLASTAAKAAQGEELARSASSIGDTSGVGPPGFYHITAGNFTVTALNDGTLLLPLDRLMKGAATVEIQHTLTKYHRSLPTETPENCFLIYTNGMLILVDAGGGDVYRSGGLGSVLESVARAGCHPEQINNK
jgi:hypothetical protein